jgi:hypothetical protein
MRCELSDAVKINGTSFYEPIRIRTAHPQPNAHNLSHSGGTMRKLTNEQLGRLLFKSQHEPRKNPKRFLKDLGGEGSAEELDRVLATARRNKDALAESERLEKQRALVARSVDLGVDARMAEMIADVRVRMQERQLTQQAIADHCGWPPSLVAAYLTGAKEPGAKNLAKLATAVGCIWRLAPSPTAM